MTIALVLYLLFLLGYAALAGIVVWNIGHYLLLEDKKGRRIVRLFIAAGVILIGLSLVSFWAVPWDRLIRPIGPI